MIAALLWLLGVEVLPNLHLAAHDHDHTHAADGSIVRHAHAPHDAHDDAHAHAHTHHHDAVDDERLAHVAYDETLAYLVYEDGLAPLARAEHDHSHESDVDSVPAHDEDEHLRHSRELVLDAPGLAGHAATGIAHHAMALHEPAPPATMPVALPAAETWTYPAANERVRSALHTRPNARGPPVA